MNKQFITGRLTRDPEKGTTASGVNWCSCTVAVRKKRAKEGEPDADFIRVTAWRGLGDTCAQFLAKGRMVAVLGTPSVSQWTGQNGSVHAQNEITADEVDFLSPREGAGATAPASSPAMTPADDDPDKPW